MEENLGGLGGGVGGFVILLPKSINQTTKEIRELIPNKRGVEGKQSTLL